ncbi:DUF1304 domain-containing protein [Micrococcales bacterium 31B]|nr:DUF1304 domain-containing protein [Micrococcales bacterium 31B]
MTIAGLIFAALAALLHVYIFYLESLAWTTPRARAAFGTTADQAASSRELAFNQGFYNLFLAIAVALGMLLYALGHAAVGLTLIFTGIGSMTAAALVLLASSPRLAGSAVKQGTLPVVALVCLAIGLMW